MFSTKTPPPGDAHCVGFKYLNNMGWGVVFAGRPRGGVKNQNSS